jgi:hypothetical protein
MAHILRPPADRSWPILHEASLTKHIYQIVVDAEIAEEEGRPQTKSERSEAEGLGRLPTNKMSMVTAYGMDHWTYDTRVLVTLEELAIYRPAVNLLLEPN